MAKYHISPETGNPNLCRAQAGNCPFGSESEHYGSREEARSAFEQAQTVVAPPVRKVKSSVMDDPRRLLTELKVEVYNDLLELKATQQTASDDFLTFIRLVDEDDRQGLARRATLMARFLENEHTYEAHAKELRAKLSSAAKRLRGFSQQAATSHREELEKGRESSYYQTYCRGQRLDPEKTVRADSLKRGDSIAWPLAPAGSPLPTAKVLDVTAAPNGWYLITTEERESIPHVVPAYAPMEKR